MNTENGSAAQEHSVQPSLESNTLQSWKEIASYLKRGVRTAQRWERDAGLPVRRLPARCPRPGENKCPVFAFPEEIDKWLHSRPTRKLAF